MLAENLCEIDKRAGYNKAVQVEIFQKLIVKNHKNWENFNNQLTCRR